MNVREVLNGYAEYAPMTVRDLKGVVRKQVIQVDVLRLAPDFEIALHAAYKEGYEEGVIERGCVPEDGVTAGIAAMVEEG
ncbi:hypothetical protein LCGC14_1678140 [marine sediment metagenome]|uniref:Uncharacterized protein n=1 Tax=marine sediment metagenome TaxID=412755 RepID=A0A0F9HPI1_9ZZZZ